MRAAVLTAPGTVPGYAAHPDPVAGDGTAVVRVTAAPIVPLDQLAASGTSYFGVPAVPYVPGVQGVGVVGAIVPWNVPQFVTMSKLGPALLSGSTIVIKPSPETPLDEPRPPRVQDPPAQPDQKGPYVVRGSGKYR